VQVLRRGVLLVLGTIALPGQDPVRILPGNYSRLLENDRVRVIRIHYGPHEKPPDMIKEENFAAFRDLFGEASNAITRGWATD